MPGIRNIIKIFLAHYSSQAVTNIEHVGEMIESSKILTVNCKAVRLAGKEFAAFLYSV